MRPDGGAREVIGVDQKVNDLFSSRRRAITTKTKTLVAAFEVQFGRSPNALELDRLQRSATFATRNAKSHQGETLAERLDRWDGELRAEVRGGLAQVAAAVLSHGQAVQKVPAWSVGDVIDTALADVQQTKAAWTAPDLTRALSNALPDHSAPGRTAGRPPSRRADRRSRETGGSAGRRPARATPMSPTPSGWPAARRPTRRPGGKLYATPDQLNNERLLALRSRLTVMPPAISRVEANKFIAGLAAQGIELGADQAAAVRGVSTSGAEVESLVGPAGTGKSFVVGAIAKAWTDPNLWAGQSRRVVGLAASQIATGVLADEGSLPAISPGGWPPRTDWRPATIEKTTVRWRLRSGDLVVVDESAMADTAALVRIHAHCQQAGREAAARRRPPPTRRGRGGRRHGPGRRQRQPDHELVETRRFTQAWEGAASLRLRARDQTVLAEYHKQGRAPRRRALEQAETAAAARAWLADTLAGQHSLLIVDTNEQVARLSAQLRADLVRLGRVDDERTVPLGLQGTWAGVGDIVQARHNGWHLAGYAATAAARSTESSTASPPIREDGGLEVVARPRPAPTGLRANAWSCRPATSPSTWRSATPPPSTPPKASPSTPATPSSPKPQRPTRSMSA